MLSPCIHHLVHQVLAHSAQDATALAQWCTAGTGSVPQSPDLDVQVQNTGGPAPKQSPFWFSSIGNRSLCWSKGYPKSLTS